MHFEKVSRDLAAQVGARQPEIVQAVLTRVESISGPDRSVDPEYATNLREAVRSTVAFVVASLDLTEEQPEPIPAALLSQARLAARNQVNLDTVLRRCIAGFALLGDYLIQEAETGLLEGPETRRVLRIQATLLDRVLVAVTEEYGRAKRTTPSAEQRRIIKIKKLLAGELIDDSDLSYDFEGFHLGIVASGPDASTVVKMLVKTLNRRLLVVRMSEGVIWAWLGSRDQIDSEALENLASSRPPSGVAIGIGEPGVNLPGWRLTHRQAQAALPIARHRAEGVARYVDVALVTSMLQDDLLATSLRQIYLAPLDAERDCGTLARDTLAAYFATGRNTSSAAAMLGVSRQAVASRLRNIERRIGRPLNSCAAEMEAALRLTAHDDRR